jgi:hypothetical protein
MSAAKHTPGPWRIETLDGKGFHLPNGTIHQILATVNGYPSTVSTIEEYCEVPHFEADRLADARLIAAAPNLLKALQDLADAAQARENPMGDPCALLAAQANLRDATRRARAAIAKATGSEP